MFIYLDIETIPTQSEQVKKRIADNIKPPANMSKPETIEKWWKESSAEAIADAVAKTSFDPAFGEICTIGWAREDGYVTSKHRKQGEGEADVLQAFFDDLPALDWGQPTFVGHYISGFDLRFIVCRAIVLGVPIPKCIPRDAKPWDKFVFDTMTAWAGAKGTISLDNLCAALGIEGKKDFDGSQVAEAWANGEHEKISEYCRDDVYRVRSVHQRFVQVGW